MTTKQKPSTPLPWKLHMKASYSTLSKKHDHLGARLKSLNGESIATVLEGHMGVDAAYIAHAANAYPRLAEALRDIEMETRSGGQWTAAEINEVARAILRDLGED